MLKALIKDIAEDIAQKRPVRSLAGTVDDLAQAYDIQEEIRPSLGPICGRKIAVNAPALMAAASVTDPIVGYITGDAPLTSGTVLRPSDFGEMALEPEFAAVVGQDISAGTVLNAETLPQYVSRFSLAFEVLDKRNDSNAMHAPTFVANNVFNAGIVLGADALDMQAIDQGSYSAEFMAAGEQMFAGENTAPQNPIEAAVFVINHFTRRGDTVRAGEVILCGAHHPPKAFTRAGEYVFSLSSGENVSLSISL